MKSKEEMNNVYFEGRELIHAGWAGGDIPEKNIYKHFYVDKKDSPADDVNHYAVWWDLTDFFEAEEKQVFDWPEPQVYYPISDDSADSV
ncbi:hypothetical protein AB6N22_12760, partial [Kocuria palustris]|uniref:hypothetical protein n=2 Tax=Bacillati TaxID=1783272 RepID=UPI0039A07F9A